MLTEHHRPDEGGNNHFWNIVKFRPDYSTKHQEHSHPHTRRPWEPAVSPKYIRIYSTE
jgi:hypothetical protein